MPAAVPPAGASSQIASSSPAPAAPPNVRVRRLPARPLDPPYDDELGTETGVHGSLALAQTKPAVSGAMPLRLVLSAPEPEDDEPFGPHPTPRTGLPDPRPWARRLAQAVLEVLTVQRPAPQLLGWTSRGVYADVERAVTRAARGGAAARRHTPRPVVGGLHVSEPCDGVAEACAVVRIGERSRAVALRLEGLDGRWQCTALQIG